MSNLPRRMQIRALKRLGYGRTRYALRRDVEGVMRPVAVSRAGIILDANDNIVGYRWPKPQSASLG